MPLYSYLCSECNRISDHVHGMNEIAQKCPLCFCERLSKVFPSFLSKIETKQQIGSVVKNTIEETKIELQDIKKSLQNRTFDASKK